MTRIVPLRALFGGRERATIERDRPSVLVALLIVGTAIAYFRVPADSRAVLWSEDGAVFLEQAYRSSLIETLGTGWAGYAHLLPRLVASATAVLPVEAAPIATSISMAMITSALALAVYWFSAAHLATSSSRLLAWLLVVAAPAAGLEIALSTANAQWYLLPIAVLVVLSRRAGIVATIATATILVVSIGSNVLALALIAVTVLRTVLYRTASEFAIVAASVLAGVYQIAVMLGTTRGSGLVLPDPYATARSFLIDVIGVGWLGPEATRDLAFSGTVGMIVFALLGALTVGLLLLRGSRVFAWTMAAISSVLFLVIVVLVAAIAGTILAWLSVGVGSRYLVPSVILLGFAMAAIVDAGLRREIAWRRAIAIAILVVQTTVVASSFRGFDPRDVHVSGPSWDRVIEQVRAECEDDPDGDVYLRGSTESRYDWDDILVPCAVVLR